MTTQFVMFCFLNKGYWNIKILIYIATIEKILINTGKLSGINWFLRGWKIWLSNYLIGFSKKFKWEMTDNSSVKAENVTKSIKNKQDEKI